MAATRSTFPGDVSKIPGNTYYGPLWELNEENASFLYICKESSVLRVGALKAFWALPGRPAEERGSSESERTSERAICGLNASNEASKQASKQASVVAQEYRWSTVGDRSIDR